MWALWSGMCMQSGCHRDATAWITTQLTWRSPTNVWTFCEGHAGSWLDFFVRGHIYFIQFEAAGTIQQELPLD